MRPRYIVTRTMSDKEASVTANNYLRTVEKHLHFPAGGRTIQTLHWLRVSSHCAESTAGPPRNREDSLVEAIEVRREGLGSRVAGHVSPRTAPMPI